MKPKRKQDKLFKDFIRSVNRNMERYSLNYSKSEDGLPKPRITKDDIESWN